MGYVHAMAAVAPSPVESEIDLLLEQFGPRLASGLTRRELVAEGLLAAVLAAACAALLVLVDSERPWSWVTCGVLVAAFAAARRVQFQAGAGYTTPTELFFVPMLFAAPLAAVPLLVIAANVLGELGASIRKTRPWHKLLLNVNDAWYAIGPVTVLAAAGAQAPSWSDWPIYLAALASQFAVDFALASTREGMALGASPAALLRILPWIWLIDALLAPAGLLAAFAGESWRLAFVLLAPLPVALGVFTHERRRRLAQAIELRAARADIERRDLLRREALEINDRVVQHLTVAHYLLARGDVDEARQLVARSLGEGKQIIGDLLEDVEPGQLRRSAAAG